MLGDMVAPISRTSARDILKQIIADDPRFQRLPTQEEAERIAQEMIQQENLFVNKVYLFNVWCEYFREGGL